MKLINTHFLSFRRGQEAEIIGIEEVTPEGYSPRMCYRIRYEDGVEDFTATDDIEAYEIEP